MVECSVITHESNSKGTQVHVTHFAQGKKDFEKTYTMPNGNFCQTFKAIDQDTVGLKGNVYMTETTAVLLFMAGLGAMGKGCNIEEADDTSTSYIVASTESITADCSAVIVESLEHYVQAGFAAAL